MSEQSYQNKTVVITGASGGLGSAVASDFYRLGANVALLDLSRDALAAKAAELDLAEERSLLLDVDVSNEQAVHAAVDAVVERFGRIDVLCNIAGICGPSARAEDYTFHDFESVYRVNVFGTFLTMKYTLPVMQKQGAGSVINTGSVSGIDGYPFEIGYGSSKAAVIELTRNAANENGGNGVTVNCVSPGWIDTAMMHTVVGSYTDVGIDDVNSNVTLGPLNRPCTAEEVAKPYVFLASDDARIINGANLLCDGGMILG